MTFSPLEAGRVSLLKAHGHLEERRPLHEFRVVMERQEGRGAGEAAAASRCAPRSPIQASLLPADPQHCPVTTSTPACAARALLSLPPGSPEPGPPCRSNSSLKPQNTRATVIRHLIPAPVFPVLGRERDLTSYVSMNRYNVMRIALP